MTTFAALGVPAGLVAALARQGISTPTPIQAATLPDSLAGRDVLGRGRTGSGKTYAFLVPVVARLLATPRRPARGRPRALILAPTRELASQIEASFVDLAGDTALTSRTVFGGVGQNPQVSALRRGVDVVIACPGRLEDLIGQGHVSLADIEITVLDEADHMADLGFLPGVKRLLDRTPRDGQRMLFSATLDAGVRVIVDRYLNRPVTHEADSAQSPVETMTHHVLRVADADHLDVLTDLVAAPGRAVVFARTKHRAKRFARQLNARGVPAVELHGNLSQNARTRTMTAFHSGAATTLVATDIAARGIHVDDVGLVIHADPPVEHKAYLHRSGRTARAGSAGTVITLATPDQHGDVRALMRKAGIRPTTTPVRVGHELLAQVAPGQREYAGAYLPETAPAQGGHGSSGVGRRGRSGSRADTAGRSSASNQSRRGRASGDRAAAGPAQGDGARQGRAGTGRPQSGRSQSGGSQSARAQSGRPQSRRSQSARSQSGRSQPARAQSGGRRRSAADFSAGR